MLVLSRKRGESVLVGTNVRIVVKEITGQRVRLVIEAPRSVRVLRSEIDPTIGPANSENCK